MLAVRFLLQVQVICVSFFSFWGFQAHSFNDLAWPELLCEMNAKVVPSGTARGSVSAVLALLLASLSCCRSLTLSEVQ